ncbi:MAG TPA: Xaa-Pro peptidase family protein [Marmoricola sp.]|nr:Xaa-Pro peptidase family protein [Marmoricola sp.]
MSPELLPFSRHEYDARVASTRRRMEAEGLDALVLSGPENIYYLTGLDHQGYFALTLLVLPLDGRPMIVARAMEATTLSAQVPECDHIRFADDEDPALVAARAVRSAVTRGSRVGVERSSMFFPLSVWEPLRLELAELQLVDGTGLVEAVRQVKSPAEIARMRAAARVSSRAVEVGAAAVRAGASQRDVAAAVYPELVLGGTEVPGFAPLIRSRDDLFQEHVTWADREITPGDAILLELSASVGRYHAPLTRMVYVDEPPAGTDKAGEIALAGLEVVCQALRPGTLSTEVYAAWQQVVDEGLGHRSYRRHHCGYQVGIGFPPSWIGGAAVVGLRDGSNLRIEEGMTFHVLSWLLGQEPADYVVSDTVLVTASGGELLTSTRRTPLVVGALEG